MLFDSLIEHEDLKSAYRQASNDLERRKILKRYYKRVTPDLLYAAQDDLSVWGADPYAFDFRFNPNEELLWGSIRRLPMPMYPEFPVSRFFVDFGNPFLKLALEADGATFHNVAYDTERDRALLHLGWKTFRVSYNENIEDYVELGAVREEFALSSDSEAKASLENWLLRTADGVVDAVHFFYFMTAKQQAERLEALPGYFHLAKRTLQLHRYVDFALPAIKVNIP